MWRHILPEHSFFGVTWRLTHEDPSANRCWVRVKGLVMFVRRGSLQTAPLDWVTAFIRSKDPWLHKCKYTNVNPHACTCVPTLTCWEENGKPLAINSTFSQSVSMHHSLPSLFSNNLLLFFFLSNSSLIGLHVVLVSSWIVKCIFLWLVNMFCKRAKNWHAGTGF